jgi:hypothetical protein
MLLRLGAGDRNAADSSQDCLPPGSAITTRTVAAPRATTLTTCWKLLLILALGLYIAARFRNLQIVCPDSVTMCATGQLRRTPARIVARAAGTPSASEPAGQQVSFAATCPHLQPVSPLQT